MEGLAWLLDPVSLEAFFRDHWDRKPLHVPGGATKFADQYDVTNWHRGWLTETKAATTDERGLPVEVAIDPAQSHALYLAGMTICAEVSADPKLAPFLRAFRRSLDLPGGPAFAKLYASSDDRGFALHADKHHVFVMQMSGKKRWRFSREPLVPSPTEGVRLDAAGRPVQWTGGQPGAPVMAGDAPVAAPDPETFDSVLLEEGHCLYLPPGTWHAPRAVGHSIAISVSPPRTPATELFSKTLVDLLLQRPEWRRDVVATPGDVPPPGEVPRSVSSFIQARLDDLRAALDALDVRVLHRLWRLNVAAGQGDDDASRAFAPVDPDSIKRSDVIARAGGKPLEFLVAPGPDGQEEIFFYSGVAEWNLPASARRLLTEIARHDEFRAEEALAWDRTLRFEDVRRVLASLVEAGVLRRS